MGYSPWGLKESDMTENDTAVPPFILKYCGLGRAVLPMRRVCGPLEQTTKLGRLMQNKAGRGEEMPQRAGPESGGCLGPWDLTTCP